MDNFLPLCMAFIGWLLGGFCSGAIGMGAAIIALPICLMSIPPAQAVLSNTIVTFYSSALLMITFRHFAVWDDVRDVIIGAIPGCFIGTVILKTAPVSLLQFLIGVMLIFFVVMQKFQRVAYLTVPNTRAVALFFGVLTGISSTAVAMVGAPLGIYILLKHWSFLKAKGNLAYIFIFAGTGSMLMQLCAGLYTLELLPMTIAGIAGCTIGQLTGVKVGQYINQKLFVLLLMCFLTVSAIILFNRAFS